MLLTDALAAGLLNHLFREGASPALTEYHLALTTDVPARDGTFAEVDDPADPQVWGNYVRAVLDADEPGTIFAAATAGLGGQVVATADPVSFGTAEVVGGEPEARGFILMSAATGGSGFYRGPLARELVHFVGLATDNTIYAPDHGRANGHKVVFVGPDLPTGISEGEPYWVIGAGANAFQVSEEPGGSAVPLTADGGGLVGLARFAVIQDGNPVSIPAGDLAFALR